MLYTKSSEQVGAIQRVSFRTQPPAVKTLNVGVAEPLAIYRLPVEAKSVRKPENTTFDLLLGSNAKTDAMFLCTVPADPEQGREQEVVQV